MSNVNEIKAAISELWEAEAGEILNARKQRQEQANELRQAHRAMLSSVQASKRLRAEAESLEPEHNRALLADDTEKAEQIKARHKELVAEADAAFSRASGALQKLEDAGVRGVVDLDDVERAVEGRIAALEAQSKDEIETVEHVLGEASELVEALQQQAKPFYRAKTTGTEARQARAIELQRAG